MIPKTLYLARHAKSDWDRAALSDHDRILAQRGVRDASMMGRRLADSAISPELIISSTATRAVKTAQLIALEIGYPEDAIMQVSDIYDAYVDDLEPIIHEIDDTLTRVMLVGHNPGITELVNWLSGANISNIPTGGIVTLRSGSDNSWRGFSKAGAELIQYDYPKRG